MPSYLQSWHDVVRQRPAIESGVMRASDKRARARARLPEFDLLCEQARRIKDHTLAHLDFYLEQFEIKHRQAGGQVHWCSNAAEACRTVLAICQLHDARWVIKSKSMVTEEIGLNAFLEAHGINSTETDLGEYIAQLRGEPPSHIVAPVLHLTTDDVIGTFRKRHRHLPADRPLRDEDELLAEARTLLRERFLKAPIGITGANFLVAQTGSVVTVTNEGNAELTQIIPPVHITITGIEKVVPTLEDVTTLLRVLSRSASGQEQTAYTSLVTGVRRQDDSDGPTTSHVILLDNGRAELLGGDFREILRCIRCGACLNHCPVYSAIGGHAYGWIYPGPLGAVLAPAMLDPGSWLPQASTFCGRCEQVCPVKIPLPKLMRQWREQQFTNRNKVQLSSWGLALWGYLAQRPRIYRLAASIGAAVLAWLGRNHGSLRSLPGAGSWTKERDLPAPEGNTFISCWRRAAADRSTASSPPAGEERAAPGISDASS